MISPKARREERKQTSRESTPDEQRLVENEKLKYRQKNIADE
mgnify:CR=1 FL=1